MLTRTFNLRHFLRAAYGSEPFAEYCEKRHLPFTQIAGFPMQENDYHRWQTALASLPAAQQMRIELELAQVDEMANPDALRPLLDVMDGRQPPTDGVPGDIPLALWFFLRHPDLFHQAFLHQELGDVDCWRTATGPIGVACNDLHSRQEALAKSLREYFAVRDGTGRFCAVDSYCLESCVCFAVYLSDRLHLFDVFTEQGEHTTHAARPAFPALFVYYPADGRMLLKTRQRSRDRILDLFRRFGREVLGVNLDASCLAPAFRLDLLKRRFDPLPDAPDMGTVRVKALTLLYPQCFGRRRLKLETLLGDSQFAILDLLREHGGEVLDQLAVVYAELEVPLFHSGHCKNWLIRLWPDRCSLNQTPLGERLRRCLRHWGIAYE